MFSKNRNEKLYKLTPVAHVSGAAFHFRLFCLRRTFPRLLGKQMDTEVR